MLAAAAISPPQASAAEEQHTAQVFFLAALRRSTHFKKTSTMYPNKPKLQVERRRGRGRGRAQLPRARTHTILYTPFVSSFLRAVQKGEKKKTYRSTGSSSPVPVCNTIIMAEEEEVRKQKPLTEGFLLSQDGRKKGMKMGRGWMIVTTMAKACTHYSPSQELRDPPSRHVSSTSRYDSYRQ